MEDGDATVRRPGVERNDEPPEGHLRWATLGGVGVAVGDVDAPLAPQSRFVVGLLLRSPGRAVPLRDLVQDHEDDEERAVAAARVAVSRARRALEDIAEIALTAAGYVIDADPQAVDHVRFETLVRDARAGEWPAAAKQQVERALAMWSSPPFGELRDHPAFDADGRALEELHRSAVDLWCELVVSAGLHVEELDGLERAVVEEPLREERWCSLMIAHYRAGNQAAAVRTYDRARDVLRDELGLDPGPALQSTLGRVLDQDPELEWRPVRRAPRPTTMTSLSSLSTAAVVLGRTGEIHDVLSMIDRCRVVTVVGLGGIGKSALAGEIARTSTRPAWIAVLADVHDGADVIPAVAGALGISARIDDVSLSGVIATHLQSSGGLLVLDNCEHLAGTVADLAGELSVAAPDARILATSRVELDVTGGVSFRLGRLDTGSPESPGPAALIAADHASIGRSAMVGRWDEIEAICRRSDGIPLALQLLAAASTSGGGASAIAADAVSAAVLGAVDALPLESRRLVMLLAAMPAGTSVELLAELRTRSASEIRAVLGYAVRASLVVQRSGSDTTRIRLIEPARDVLAPLADPGSIVEDLADAVLRLALSARPSPVDRLAYPPASLLDDEHDLVTWLLHQVTGVRRLELACALSPIWRAAGRTTHGAEVLALCEADVASASPGLRCRYWIARAQIAPSVANRVQYIDGLQESVRIAVDEGLGDEELRARSELTLALGWKGDVEAAFEQLLLVTAQVPEGNTWAENSVATLHAMGKALMGDAIGASDDLVAVSVGYRDGGDRSDAMWAASVAARYAREAGDLGRAARAVAVVEDLVADRFMRFAHASLVHERALLAVAAGRTDAGPQLWEALGLLTESADQRAIEACRCDLGVWRLDHGDRHGLSDVVSASSVLLDLEPDRAVVGLRRVTEELDARGDDDRSQVIRSAVELLGAGRVVHDRASLGVEQRGMLDAAMRVLAGLHGGGAT